MRRFKMEVGLLFANNGILALNKPAGMISQGPKTSAIPELWELLRKFYPKGHIAHRIDQFTTGINLFGISRAQIGYLMGNWHSITQKVYLAVIASPEWDEKTVDTPLKGKSAVTSFLVLERVGQFALVRCQLVKNGRTHQIRKHLKSIGHPIVGDQKYKGPKTSVRKGQLLHAWRMEVRLPEESGKPCDDWTTIQSPIPDDFKSFGFDLSRWDDQANPVVITWQVSRGWKRKKSNH